LVNFGKPLLRVGEDW